MRKIYKVTMGILYTIMGILVLFTLVILFYDKLDFLHIPKLINKYTDSYVEVSFDDDDDALTFPISAVKAMDLVYRFADPYTNKRYEYGEIVEINEKEYHAIYSSLARPLVVELQTGDIFVYDENEGLITLEEVIPELIDHRKYMGSEKYEDGYKLFHYYMRTLIDKRDRKLATSLKDTSYFEKGVPEKKKEQYKKIVKTTESCQEMIIVWSESLEKRRKNGEIDDYEIGYAVSSVDEYVDNDGAKWVDISVELTGYYESDGYIDTEGEFYRISVKEYGNNWKVARISES